MIIHRIEARDLPDLWFQAVHDILDYGKRFTIDRGSYAGQTRLEYDYFIGHVHHPGAKPLIPDIPPSCGIPNPVEEAYVYGGKGYDRSYIEYIMSPRKEPGESYTYGERMTQAALVDYSRDLKSQSENYLNDIYYYEERDSWKEAVSKIDNMSFLNQIEFAIWAYKNRGYRNNQIVLQVAQPSDMLLKDPPCLRSIDTRIQDGRLHFFVYFRSWDLWGGLPANLAGIQTLKEYMASEIGVGDGEMIVESKGLHLYGYAEDLAKMRCMKEI